MPRRISVFTFAITLGVVILILFAGPAGVLAQIESNDVTSPPMSSYCNGFKSQLDSSSTKERALFSYHQNLVSAWDADLSFQAGAMSSERVLEELKTDADANNLRVVIFRIAGELCGFSRDGHNLMNTMTDH